MIFPHTEVWDSPKQWVRPTGKRKRERERGTHKHARTHAETHTHAYTHTQTHPHTCTDTHTQTHTLTVTDKHTHSHTQSWTHTHTHLSHFGPRCWLINNRCRESLTTDCSGRAKVLEQERERALLPSIQHIESLTSFFSPSRNKLNVRYF